MFKEYIKIFNFTIINWPVNLNLKNMIVNRTQLKELRSKRTSQAINTVIIDVQNNIALKQAQFAQEFNRSPLQQFYSENCTSSQSNFDNSNQYKKKFQNVRSNSSIKRSQHLQVKIENQKLHQKNKGKMNFDINLSGKRLKDFMVALPNGINYQQIYSLDLSNNIIKQILPTVLIPFEHLKQLNLSMNTLQKISFPYNKMKLRSLQILGNNLSNLNLQHLKCLEHVNASCNKIIFITLPECIQSLNLEDNSISNTYFIQKCKNIETLNLNSNLIYDLNFNSMTQLDSMIKTKSYETRFNKILEISCKNNKICHLNGFKNIKNLIILNLQSNQLIINRENMNELFELQKIQELNLSQNPIEGIFTLQLVYEFLINKLKTLNIINQKPKQFYIKSKNCESSQNSEKHDLQDQSSIRQECFYISDEQEKPIRLFLDQQVQNKSKVKIKSKKQKQKQWIYTLGDNQQNIGSQDNQAFNLMITEDKKMRNYRPQEIKGLSEIRQDKLNLNKSKIQTKFVENTITKTPQKINLQQKVFKLQSQLLMKQKCIELSLTNILYQKDCYELTSQVQSMIKVILEMSFIPPQPISYLSKSTLISKRIDQDEDEYIIFSRFFQKKGGILYLKKIFALEEDYYKFQNQQYQRTNNYSFGFVNHQEINQMYKQMLSNDVLLCDSMKVKERQNQFFHLNSMLSAVPSTFGCYHIGVSYLNNQESAFQKRKLTPTCYLIESKRV